MKFNSFSKRIRPRTLRLEPLEGRDLLTTFPTVIIETNLGEIPLEMYDDTAPQTVANFLKYVDDGAYTNAIFHRIIEDFVVQGGGFRSSSEVICSCTMSEFNPNLVSPDLFSEIPTNPPVVNEFQRSNVTSTVAMAKLGNDPNSATSQFFFNLGDNSSNLDFQNGGFTVFAGLLNDAVVRQMESGSVANLSSIFPPGSRLRAIESTSIFSTAERDNVRIVRMEGFSGTAIVAGTVFLDLNQDGLRSPSDGGISSATVYLDLNRNGSHESNEPITTADSFGQFEFQVAPGEYQVRVSPIQDYDRTSTNDLGSDFLVVNARIGRRFTNNDFGFTYVGTSWHNSRLATDVDGMNGTVPLDALLAVNELTLRQFSNPDTGALPLQTSPPAQPQFLDVDNNLIFSPLDALLVINSLPNTGDTSASETNLSKQSRTTPENSVGVSPFVGFRSQNWNGILDEDERTIGFPPGY